MEEAKKYELKKPKAPDVFIMSNIIGKIGVNKFASCLKNEDVQALVKDVSKRNKKINEEDVSAIVGIGVVTEVAQIVLEGMPKCEDDIYKLLSNVSNLEIEEVKELDGVTFLTMIIDFLKNNMDFIKAVSTFAK